VHPVLVVYSFFYSWWLAIIYLLYALFTDFGNVCYDLASTGDVYRVMQLQLFFIVAALGTTVTIIGISRSKLQ